LVDGGLAESGDGFLPELGVEGFVDHGVGEVDPEVGGVVGLAAKCGMDLRIETAREVMYFIVRLIRLTLEVINSI